MTDGPTTASSPSSSPASHRGGRAIPAFVLALIGGALVIALPFIARTFDGSADEFSSRTFPILPAIGWLICAVLAAIVVTHRVQIWFSVDEGTIIAIAYDLLPLALFMAPVITLWALVSGHQLLAVAGAGLTAYHLVLVIPRLMSDHIPQWARVVPKFSLAVANVYVDNPTPDAAARQLVESGADVVVIAEATPDFMRHFDAAGGSVSHPHRVSDPRDTSDYAVAIASRLPLGAGLEMRDLGPLRLAVADVDVDGIMTTVVALNPMSAFDENGHTIWKQQIEALKAFVPSVRGPLVVAGDLNATQFRPDFDELLKVGLSDAIDSLGQAWKPSFSLRSVSPLGALGLVARLDQALVNDRVRALKVHNLKSRGSDHLPFEITLAVRQSESSA